MNSIKYLMMCLTFIMQGSYAQETPKDIYNADFKWRISIPEGMKYTSAAEQARLIAKGKDAIEDTYNEKVVNEAKSIFDFRSDAQHFFESNYQPFDPVVDGDYDTSCKKVNEVVYGTFKAQLPGAQIDTLTTKTIVDKLEFNTFKIKITVPGKIVIRCVMFSRLFGKKELAVNIMYVDEKKGKAMLDAWMASTFGK